MIKAEVFLATDFAKALPTITAGEEAFRIQVVGAGELGFHKRKCNSFILRGNTGAPL
jgi:hypothetical protein